MNSNRLSKSFKSWALVLALPLFALVASPVRGEATDGTLVHITLEKSAPADEAKVGSVSEVRLFFTGAPLLRGASVRIVTANRTLVRSSPPAADPTDGKQLFTRVDAPLAPGSYVVQWRCIADDGHVMRGDFRFEVTG
jgi:methionine-rich copper-binding protein CopC